MWIKYIKTNQYNKKGSICWTDDDTSALREIHGGFAVRCLNPDGDIFEDSPPEKIIKQLATEDGVDFLTEEAELQRVFNLMPPQARERFKYGMYIDNEHLKIKQKYKK